MTLAGLKEIIKARAGTDKYCPCLGDVVEVYWVDEKVWYEGEVIDTRERGEYRVHYVSDSQKLWHDRKSRVRLKTL